MKRKLNPQSAFFRARIAIALVLFLAGVFVALEGMGSGAGGANSSGPQPQSTGPSIGAPDSIQLIGPVSQNQDLRALPYVPPNAEHEERILTRYPHGTGQIDMSAGLSAGEQRFLNSIWQPAPTMPGPLVTFDGISETQSGCGCAPPDTDGDVGPNHYIEAINSSFKIFDKSGNTLAGPTTFNSFFAALIGTPCAAANDGDPYVLYDPVADRWLISDFAFAAFPGALFYQCIGVSQTSDPVSGGWYLYAVQVDATNPTFLGDYPKFGFWNNPQPNGAYFLTVNLFSNPTTFNGVRVFAFDRGSMLSGGPVNAVAFTIPTSGLGDSYSLVPATFRAGSPPPAGRDEFLLAVDSPASENTALTQVKGWLFHVDFATPANSTLGNLPNHTPNASITVSSFVEAWTNSAGVSIVPQQGTTQKLDTLGDKIMTPVVYQNLAGTESLWADQTNILNFPTGPTIIRWYQFNVTGGSFPATAAQQQDWSNGLDGLWRFMPSIAVDASGNAAIAYSTSNSANFPGIRYAGRLAGDPSNNLGQGEATMFSGTGSQTSPSRWGDYSMTTVDPSDGMTFWHVNEYYATNGSFTWNTRIGKFQFGSASPTPTPTATPTPSPTSTPTPTPTPCARGCGPTPTATPTPTPLASATPTPTPTPIHRGP